MSKNDEITIDFKSAKQKTAKSYENFKTFSKQNSGLITAVLLILLMITAFNVRAQAYELAYVDDIARNYVEGQYKGQIFDQIRGQNPALSTASVNSMVESEWKNFYAANKDNIERDVANLGNEFKQNFLDSNGQIYILDIDTHYYWQLTERYLRTGSTYDTILEDGTKIDSYKMAPLGAVGTFDELHPIFTAWTYKLTSPITGWDAYKTFNMMSALVAMLVVIPAFFLGKMFGGNLTGTMAGLVMALHPAYISRSVAGYVSTDGYNVLFPLLIIWMVLLAFKSTELWKQITFASLAGLFVGIFSRIWSAWWFLFAIVIISIIGYIVFILIKNLIADKTINLNKTKNPSIIVGTTASISFLTIYLLRGAEGILDIFQGLFGMAGFSIQNAIGTSGLWPNVLTTVAELSRPSTLQIVAQLGGSTIFIIAMMGIILSLLPLKNWNKYEFGIFFGGLTFAFLATTTLPMDLAINNGIDYSITFTALIMIPILAGFVNLLFSKHSVNLVFAVFASTLFVATLYTTTQGVRFTLLVVPALALALAVALGRAISYMKQLFLKKNWNLDIGYLAIVLIATFVFLPVAEAGINTGYQRVPGISDAWYDALTEIKETTPKETILTSWWDFGHWFKTLADRRVTFDGQTQSTPMAHWVGKALMTSNETESVGILRMLACGSYTGFDMLGTKLYNKELASQLSSKEFLETYNYVSEAVLFEREEALNYYLDLGLSESDALEVLNLTHCDAPPVIFITSNDMVGKAPVWGHFGLWDFEKAYVSRVSRGQGNVQTVVQDIASTLNVEPQVAQILYFDSRRLVGERAVSDFISPRPSYLTQNPISCIDETNRVICQTNIGVGQSQGFTNVITGINVDKQNVSNSRLVVTVVESATNEVVTRTNVEPAGIILRGERIEMSNPAIGLDVVLEYINGVPYALIASESLADSMFTRLYFWDGVGTERFEKFSEYSNSFAGHRTKTWNVVW